MSYVRFSSDRHQSDVYAYQEATTNLYVVHLAQYRMRPWWLTLRRLTDKKLPVGRTSVFVERRWVNWLSWKLPWWTRMVKIHLPAAGTSLRFETEKEMFTCFKVLARNGYRVPDYLLK